MEDLVGIAPHLVLVTAMDGFLAITDAVGGVDVRVGQGLRDRRRRPCRSPAARTTSTASRPSTTPAPARTLDGGDFERAAHHQALLLGYLRGLRDRQDEEGFMERAALAALGGLESDLAPTDLYRLAQAVTQIDPEQVTGCIIGGTAGSDRGGGPDHLPGHRAGAPAGEGRRGRRPAAARLPASGS